MKLLIILTLFIGLNSHAQSYWKKWQATGNLEQQGYSNDHHGGFVNESENHDGYTQKCKAQVITDENGEIKTVQVCQ